MTCRSLTAAEIFGNEKISSKMHFRVFVKTLTSDWMTFRSYWKWEKLRNTNFEKRKKPKILINVLKQYICKDYEFGLKRKMIIINKKLIKTFILIKGSLNALFNNKLSLSRSWVIEGLQHYTELNGIWQSKLADIKLFSNDLYRYRLC